MCTEETVMREMTFWRALNDGVRSAMADDSRVFIMGEDLTRWAAGGGTFGVKRGLLSEFGPERVFDTPISEEAIVVVAVGLALCGCRLIVVVMYAVLLLSA